MKIEDKERVVTLDANDVKTAIKEFIARKAGSEVVSNSLRVQINRGSATIHGASARVKT
jgi:hypothetical protein